MPEGFCKALELGDPPGNDQANKYGGTPPDTEQVKFTTNGAVPLEGVAKAVTDSGGGSKHGSALEDEDELELEDEDELELEDEDELELELEDEALELDALEDEALELDALEDEALELLSLLEEELEDEEEEDDDASQT